MSARYPFEVSARRRVRPTALSIAKWAFITFCIAVTGFLVVLQLAGVRLP